MSDEERRLAAVELALSELAAWIDPQVVEDATAAIKAGLHVQVSEDEAEIRLQAMALLADGLRRFQQFGVGAFVRGT